MPKAKRCRRLSNMVWLVRIKLVGFAGGDVAEGTGACADAAQDHHRDMLLRPALANIRTRRLFADGIELQRANEFLRFDIFSAQRRSNAQPIRLTA